MQGLSEKETGLVAAWVDSTVEAADGISALRRRFLDMVCSFTLRIDFCDVAFSPDN
jgi:hypothetical protein